VIVPFYNEEPTLDAIFSSLNESELNVGSDAQVICVDNNSTGKSFSFVENHYPDVVLLKEVKQGVTSARNKGIDYVTGEIVFFLDTDCRPTKDYFSIRQI
jgi:glycosyltransferase involved in cell wall biosynthesis